MFLLGGFPHHKSDSESPTGKFKMNELIRIFLEILSPYTDCEINALHYYTSIYRHMCQYIEFYSNLKLFKSQT